ncbi:hypothetical protein [Olivibacter sp. XZL3]|uniref:hypothetical protein n=1 Tax=Olivibacter sp. XZL3 TaxID=1735116 RepID=UPI00106599A6|nr:hypothetical protein [Olivibacter sp. XZL3]
MEITTTTIHDLHWDFPNAQDFSAQIINNKITKLCFQDVGELTNSHLDSLNEKYLRNIHRALSDLFQHIDQVRGVGNIPVHEDDSDAITAAERAQLQKDEKDMLEHRESIMNRIRKL